VVGERHGMGFCGEVVHGFCRGGMLEPLLVVVNVRGGGCAGRCGVGLTGCNSWR